MTVTLPQMLGVLALAGTIAAWGADHQAQKDAYARLHEHVRVLEHIIVSEFPAYTAAIVWKDE